MRATLLHLSLFFLSACGYHFGRGGLLQNNSTIYVPFINGDNQGFLTNNVIQALAKKGGIVPDEAACDLILKIDLLPPDDKMIGFAYATNAKGEVRKIIVSQEGRLAIAATVTLCDALSSQAVIAPFTVTASIDYDFEPDLTRVGFHDFSLGQLEMHGLAKDAAFTPLYKLLAEKIVETLLNAGEL
jgi:outer membrane lipopolysaccharide assembly protein LptE/RlpB